MNVNFLSKMIFIICFFFAKIQESGKHRFAYAYKLELNGFFTKYYTEKNFGYFWFHKWLLINDQLNIIYWYDNSFIEIIYITYWIHLYNYIFILVM